MASRDDAVVITGAESGIGGACALGFGHAGYAVALLFHNDDQAARERLGEIEAAGGSGVTIQCDVRDESSVAGAFERVEDALGIADVLINSAGLNESGIHVADMELVQWERLIATDLTGAFLTSRRFVRALHAAGRSGAIVNISSIHAKAVRAGAADYCAAKGGLKRLTETMALEEAANGIRVNAISPGMILTPMNPRAVADAEYRRSLEAAIPVGRAGTPEEVAGLALWLASPAAGYVTGASVVMDGGLSLVLGQGA
ncbi:MAG: SDR family oxidoreductase [Pseudomonadota bacterium]|nr:SDR family oxidoreductase [Pseudomonadota bacterium]